MANGRSSAQQYTANQRLRGLAVFLTKTCRLHVPCDAPEITCLGTELGSLELDEGHSYYLRIEEENALYDYDVVYMKSASTLRVGSDPCTTCLGFRGLLGLQLSDVIQALGSKM